MPSAPRHRPEGGQTQKGLMFVEICIAKRLVDALINTGVTQNFMFPELAKKLGLKLAKGTRSIKTVNSEAQPITQVEKEVPVEIGKWTGKLDFSVAPMDDFALVLGMDEMWHNNFMPLPYLSSLVVMEKDTPCLVPTKVKAMEMPTLSAMQLIKGVKKGEPTFLVAMISTHLETLPSLIMAFLKPPCLSKFYFELVYKTRRSNIVTDALSRKAELATITTTHTDLVEAIKEGLETDPVARSLMMLSKEGGTREFWLKDGLLYTKGQHVFVLRHGGLRKAMIREKESIRDCNRRATIDATHSTFRGVVKPIRWGARGLMEATGRVGEVIFDQGPEEDEEIG
ncbi:LOW QUALITY PROTEIN: hypothetical protein V2J09_022260 [Rumex salicifolius]